MARQSKTLVLTVAMVLITGAAHRRLPDEVRAQQGGDYIPQPRLAKTLSLGFDALLADYYWVQAVLVAGGSPDPYAESSRLGRLIDVVTTLDPWVDHPYRFAAVWLTQTLDDVRHANRLLRQSFDYHPDEWRNRFYLGFNLFFYLDEDAEAAEVLHEASQLPGSPTYLPRLVARLRAESESLAAAGLFLEELVRTTEDEAIRAQYQAALDEVQIEWRARQLDAARETFRERHGRDIVFVEELAFGNRAVLRALPDPEPSSVPAPLRRGSKWVVDEDSGVIVSSYYGRRYEVHIDEFERSRTKGAGKRHAARDREPEARREEDAGRRTEGSDGG